MIFFIFVLIMIQDDVFKTIAQSSEGAYSEKRSKFISFAMPVESEEEAKEYIEEIRKNPEHRELIENKVVEKIVTIENGIYDVFTIK